MQWLKWLVWGIGGVVGVYLAIILLFVTYFALAAYIPLLYRKLRSALGLPERSLSSPVPDRERGAGPGASTRRQ
ncbi:MAG: hypothetical protein V3U98_07925 [Acidobacteriota bacterium]